MNLRSAYGINCYEVLLKNKPRNNKSWHNSFNSALGGNHVTILEVYQSFEIRKVLQNVLFYLIINNWFKNIKMYELYVNRIN